MRWNSELERRRIFESKSKHVFVNFQADLVVQMWEFELRYSFCNYTYSDIPFRLPNKTMKIRRWSKKHTTLIIQLIVQIVELKENCSTKFQTITILKNIVVHYTNHTDYRNHRELAIATFFETSMQLSSDRTSIIWDRRKCSRVRILILLVNKLPKRQKIKFVSARVRLSRDGLYVCNFLTMFFFGN